MSKIKICGLTRIEDINAVNFSKPDFVGFVFAKSKRQIDFDKAKKLKQMLNNNLKVVGVFVNEPIVNIIRLCDEKIIDMIQLHGDEDEQYILDLRENINNSIIKAIRIKDKVGLKLAENLPCDYLLFDTFNENVYGGTGESFDWSIIKDVKKPFFLAGGLNINNVLTAINIVNPFCVDISSSVETKSLKDSEKISKITKLIRSVL